MIFKCNVYWNRIHEILSVESLFCDPFEIQLDDLRMLLKRFSHKASFSEDCNGGGMVSNMQFVPYMAQMLCNLYTKMETGVIKRMLTLFEQRNELPLLDLTQPSTSLNIETILDRVSFFLMIFVFPIALSLMESVLQTSILKTISMSGINFAFHNTATYFYSF